MTDLAKNLRSYREKAGLSQQQLADKAGVSQTTIDKIERSITKRTRYLGALAKSLSIQIFDLDPSIAEDFGVGDLRGTGSFILSPPEYVSSEEGIWLYNSEVGHAEESGDGQDDTMFVLARSPVDKVSKSVAPNGEDHAYAIYVAFSFMRPEIEEGDICVVDPARPPIRGTTCVLRATSGKPWGLIGRLLESSPTEWKVQQLSPDRTIAAPKADWPFAHRIVTKIYRR